MIDTLLQSCDSQCLCVCQIYKKVYSFERQSLREREISSLHWLTPQISVRAKAGTGAAWSLEFHPDLPRGWQGLKNISQFFAAPRHISRVLERKWSSLYSTQHDGMGIQEFPVIHLTPWGHNAVPRICIGKNLKNLELDIEPQVLC